MSTGGFTTQASNVARVFKDAAAAGQFIAAYKADTAGPCLQQANESDLKRRNPGADISITGVAPLEGVVGTGGDTAAYELVIPYARQQQQLVPGTWIWPGFRSDASCSGPRS